MRMNVAVICGTGRAVTAWPTLSDTLRDLSGEGTAWTWVTAGPARELRRAGLHRHLLPVNGAGPSTEPDYEAEQTADAGQRRGGPDPKLLLGGGAALAPPRPDPAWRALQAGLRSLLTERVIQRAVAWPTHMWAKGPGHVAPAETPEPTPARTAPRRWIDASGVAASRLLLAPRTRRLAITLMREGPSPVDLVHAVDPRQWPAAVHLAELLDVPLILGLTSEQALPRLLQLLPRLAPTRCRVVAETTPQAESVRRATDGLLPVEVVPPGVGQFRLRRHRRRSDAPLALLLSTDGPLDHAYTAVLEALTRFTRSRPQTVIVLEGPRPHSTTLYPLLERLGLLPHVVWTPVQHEGLSRAPSELLLQADLLLHPQAVGRVRRLTLRAMAAGVPVLAVPDPAVDHLLDDRTCWCPAPGRADAGVSAAEAWLELLERVAAEPDAAAALGARARRWVLESRSKSDMAQRWLAVYRHAVGSPLPFRV